jgi:hypothetical protein
VTFNDVDGNGWFNDGDSFMSNIDVELLDNNDQLLSTIKTDANGLFRFYATDGLIAGQSYSFRIDLNQVCLNVSFF